jgi:RNA polymerase sigma-70 factor (ECF subfamily)
MEDLIHKAQDGDKQAFAELYDKFADKIFRFVLLKVGAREQTEDILQETFIKAWQSLPKYEIEGGNFSAWLYKIAGNTVTDYYRKMYRRPETLELNENIDIAAPNLIADQLELKADIETLKQCINQLPATYRQVLELRFVQDFSIKETASILRKSNLAVRLLQHRALKQLRDILQNNEFQYSRIQ